MAERLLRRIRHIVLQPLTLMAALLLSGAIAFTLFFNQSTERERQDFVRYSEALVASFFYQMQAELMSLALDYAHGDDIAANISREPIDNNWFAQYVNSAVYTSLRVDYFAVLTADGAPAYAIHQGRQQQIERLAQWSPALEKLLHEQIGDPAFEQMRGVLQIGSQYYFVALARIQPVNKALFPAQQRFGYMLVMRPFSAAGLEQSMQELMVGNMQIRSSPQKNSGEGIYPLLGLNGEPVAYLTWLVSFPSLELQNLLRPKILLTLLVMAVFIVLITLYMRATQKRIQRARARMTAHSEALQKLVNYKASLERSEQTFLRMVTQCTASVLGCEEVTINWFEQKTQHLVCLDQYRSDGQQHCEAVYALTSEAYANWLTVKALHQHADKRTHRFAPNQLSVSIILHGEPVGMLCVTRQSLQWTQDERNFLCSVADLVALSMETEQRMRVEAVLHKREYFDVSTGLPNRQSFVRFVQHEIAAGYEAFAVVAVGLAGFGEIHDDLGHEQTEIFLCNLAKHLHAYRQDEFALARLDTHRFVLFWQPFAADTITRQLQAMQHVLSAPIAVGEHLIHPRIRIGVSLFSNDAQTADVLLQHAEFMLGRALQDGSEPVLFFDEALTEQVKARYRLGQMMHRDIGTAAFCVMLQPLVALKDNHLVGAEALLRWHNNQQEMVSPAEFIPLAEESGLIHVLWQQILEEVLQFLLHWQDKLPEKFTIALNVSTIQLRQTGFLEYLMRALAEKGISPARLEVELTETVSLDLYQYAPEVLRTLRDRGIRIVIDDFGTGYSSLSYLHDLQVDKLKIDKKFIDDMLHNEKDQSLVKMMLSLAKSLKLDVVAEGVETAQQAEFLQQEGCDIGQGFYFARPMLIADFERYLATRI